MKNLMMLTTLLFLLCPAGWAQKAKRENAATSSVRDALSWIARHQNPDGSWSLSDFSKRCGEKKCGNAISSSKDRPFLATGLALLGFQGGGSTTGFGPYKMHVRGGFTFLKSSLRADGSFGTTGTGTHLDGRAHAVCTMALAIGYSFSPRSETLKTLSQKAVDFLAKSHISKKGWPARKAKESDPVATAWTLLALKSAQFAKLVLPDQAVSLALNWLDSITDPHTFEVALTPKSPTLLPTAAALAVRLQWQVPKTDPKVQGARAILEKHIAGNKSLDDPEFIYFGTLACFRLGGSAWKAWNNKALLDRLAPAQDTRDCARGSWKPSMAYAKIWGRFGATAFGLLGMELCYRLGGRRW